MRNQLREIDILLKLNIHIGNVLTGKSEPKKLFKGEDL